jgi:hypothetical protein
LEGLKGDLRQQQFTAGEGTQAGKVKATVGQVSGVAQLRVIPPTSIAEELSAVAVGAAPAYWINTTGKYAVRDMEGNRVLVKSPTPPIFKRTRSFIGPATESDYTVEADVRAVEKRRQMGDAGVVAQRYELVLVGNVQRIELRSWQIEEKRTVKKPFAWKADVWYRLKLRVETLPGGKVQVRGKAWPVGESEPAEWTIEHVDPVGNRQGSPGIFADAQNEVLFDNLKVTKN